MSEAPPANIILERMRELREEMVDHPRLTREMLSRMSSMESRLSGIAETLNLIHTDVNRVSRRLDEHDDRIYNLEHREDQPHA